MQATLYPSSEPLIEAAGITPEMAANATFCKGRRLRKLPAGAVSAGDWASFELMMMSTKIRELTFNAAPTERDSSSCAVGEGMRTLYWDGIDKVLRGVTTLEEVLRWQVDEYGFEWRT